MNLTEYFERGELTRKELAEFVGVTETFIRMIEKKQRRPSSDVAMKLHRVTGIGLLNLLYPDVDFAESEVEPINPINSLPFHNNPK